MCPTVAEVEESGGQPGAGFTSASSPPSVAEPLPEESSQVSRPDTALNRVLHGDRLPKAPGIGRVLAVELLVVMAVFPLPAVLSAVAALVGRIELGFPAAAGSGVDWQVHSEWFWAGFEGVAYLTELAGALLVWYLLARSGEHLTALGLGGRKLRMDLALVLPVFIVVQYIPQTFGLHLLGWLHLQSFYLLYPTQSHAAITTWQVVAGFSAGIVEEIVVLGFLVRRLEQLGLRPAWVVIIAVLVRVSYHLYYGWGAVTIALWALVSVLVYLRIRRLLPFILCHIAWDVAIPIGFFYNEAYHFLFIAAVVATVAFMLLWAKRPANPEPGLPSRPIG